MALSKVLGLGLLAAVLPLAWAAPASVDPKILNAMKRDLGLNAEQATARIAQEISATSVIDELRSSAGESFAGAWVANNGNTISVGITDKALADAVTAAGAKPIVMVNSLSKLQEAKEALDKLANQSATLKTEAVSAEGVAAWYVDVIANKVILEALTDSTTNAEQMAAQIGLAESEFEVRPVKELPTTFVGVSGGDAYLISNSARCSVGFSVQGGFVSAGHCGGAGAPVTTTSGESYGSFSGSIFPGNDMSFISTFEGTALNGYINSYGGGSLPVTGSIESAPGSSVCRSGSTTGVRCGEVRNLGVTINYSQGSVNGVTETSVCAEPGDSGGSFYTGSEAQGVTSGGSGDCTSGGTTYFQPVNPILSTYGLQLVTA